MRRHKLVQVFLLTIVALFFVALISQNAERIDASSAIAQINGQTNTPTSGGLMMATISIWAISIFVVFARDKRWFLMVPITLVFASACSGGGVYATTNPRDVVFVVDLGNPTDQTQVTSQVQGDQTNPDFWNSKKQTVNIQRILIPTASKRTGPGLFGTDIGATFTAFPSLMVVGVPTSVVTVEFTAPSIVCDQPLPDMAGSFSMQSLESNGGSIAVYTGATISAHVSDPAKYLSVYGYIDIDPNTHTHQARPLEDVIKTQMYGTIQQSFSYEYGIRSIVVQNRDLATMMGNTLGKLNGAYNEKTQGITIDSFYNRDGNIYEDCRIQEQFNEELERQNEIQRAVADAEIAEIKSESLIASAGAQATATTIANESVAKAQQLEADVVNDNPLALQQQWIDKWNGQLPQVTGGDSTSYIPVMLTPVAQPTPPSS